MLDWRMVHFVGRTEFVRVLTGELQQIVFIVCAGSLSAAVVPRLLFHFQVVKFDFVYSFCIHVLQAVNEVSLVFYSLKIKPNHRIVVSELHFKQENSLGLFVMTVFWVVPWIGPEMVVAAQKCSAEL